jgi:plastocyanin
MVAGLGAHGALVSADHHYDDIEEKMKEAEKKIVEHAKKHESDKKDKHDDKEYEKVYHKSAQVLIKEPYPIQNRFVFVCDVQGFEATSYDWYFGDGHQLTDMKVNDVYHQYKKPGVYDVTCVAHGKHKDVSATKTVEAEHIIKSEANLYVTHEDKNSFIFQCDTKGFEAKWYTWFFGDTNKQITIGNDNVWHTYDKPGDYVVFCIATDGKKTQSDWIEITVGHEDKKDHKYHGKHGHKYYDHKYYDHKKFDHGKYKHDKKHSDDEYRKKYYDLKMKYEDLEKKYAELEKKFDMLYNKYDYKKHDFKKLDHYEKNYS